MAFRTAHLFDLKYLQLFNYLALSAPDSLTAEHFDILTEGPLRQTIFFMTNAVKALVNPPTETLCPEVSPPTDGAGVQSTLF